MARHRSYGIEFKRQVAQKHLGAGSLNALARRHDVSRNLLVTACCRSSFFERLHQFAEDSAG